MQQGDKCNGNRATAFRERMSSAIGDKHQSTLTKMGAILGMGLIDAGGRNCRLDLCRSGDDGDPYGGPVRLTNVVGMALWLQHWHWYPMMHMVSLVLTPTVTVALKGDFRYPRNFEFVCDAKPSAFAYPKKLEEKKEEKKKAEGGAGLDSTLMTLTCVMCGLLYAIRTMFLLFSVTWLSEVYCTHYHPKMDFNLCKQEPTVVGNVAQASLLFTFFGMFSVLLSGQTKDMIPKRHRGFILLVNSIILVLTTSAMSIYDLSLSFPMAVFLVGMIGFGDFGPYKTMSGAFAVDIGGKARKGDVTAWMGVASNGCGALILVTSGFFPAWAAMFKILIGCSIGCCVCAMAIINYDRTKHMNARELVLNQPFLE